MFLTRAKGIRRMVLAVATTLTGAAATIAGRTEAHHPNPLGLWVFSQDIRNAPFPAWFWQPVNITKYSREMNPEL
jgi:hypothetical protein